MTEALTLLSFSFEEQHETVVEKMRERIGTDERFVQVLYGEAASETLNQVRQPTRPKRFWHFGKVEQIVQAASIGPSGVAGCPRLVVYGVE